MDKKKGMPLKKDFLEFTMITSIIMYIFSFASAEGSDSINFNYSNQPVLGNSDAPIKVVIFEDFLCPHCAAFAENVFPQLEREYGDNDKVAFFLINFPLGSFGPPSIISAVAGECAYKQGNDAFWEFHKIILRSQRKIDYTAQSLAKLASDYVPKLKPKKLKKCIEANRLIGKVNADREIAVAVANSTPTVLVNGERVNDDYGNSDPSLEAISTAIDKALGNL